MTIQNESLQKRLKKGPAILFMGQNVLKAEAGIDMLLSQTIRKYGPENVTARDYSQILHGNAQNSAESALAWMQALSDRLSIPDWISTISEYAWSSVYTSAIDTVWWKAFRKERRELSPIFDEKYHPIDIRSRQKLHFTFLFGCINQTEDDTRPPLSRREFLRRKQTAVILAHRLPEIITPFGTLIIEGYAGDHDWLGPSDLAPILDELTPGQAHIFSADSEIQQHEDFVALIAQEKLICHPESLAQFLSESKEGGHLQIGLDYTTQEKGRHLQLRDDVHLIPTELWNQTIRTAIILDDALIIEPSPISEELNYQEFRNFLMESGVRPIWSGHARGFAFRREFERDLRKKIDQKFRSRDLQKEPIILHGPSGTGKSVALASIAFEIRREKRYPVLFIERQSQRPNGYDLDAFCKWAEDHDAEWSVIIWDGMLEPTQYYELLNFLVGRGRKIVLIGSSYRISTDKISKRSNFVSVPPVLTTSEAADFSRFLDKFDKSLGQTITKLIDQNFLVALYRLLPSTRAGIRTGLVREVDFAETLIAKKTSDEEIIPEGTLGYALWKAGIINIEKLLSETKIVGGEELSTPQEIIGLIMVPGRFGLKVPLELLIHSLKKEWLQNFERILSVDIFVNYEDKQGNIFISPRHPLEAKLIVQARFGIAQQEVDFARQLISATRDYGGNDNTEVQFTIDLVRNMGPNGSDSNYFMPCFIDLSKTLEELRLNRSIENPRLMLQEATLLREYVAKQSKAGSTHPESDALLDSAENILKRSLDMISNNRGGEKLRSVILVELSATLGTRNKHILGSSKDKSRVVQILNDTRRFLGHARMLAPEDYHSIDVLAWITEDIIRSKILPPTDEAEAKANILHLFTQANPDDFDITQRELFDQRRMKIGNLIGDTNLSEEAFQALVQRNSAAGYYLRALNLAGEQITNKELSDTEKKRCLEAAKYLESNRGAIATDIRCLYLLLKCWWASKVGKPLFFNERQTVPFGESDWHYLQDIVTALINIDEGRYDATLKYLAGYTAFHLNSIGNSINIFRELERGTEFFQGKRRILRSYLASLPSGEPRLFNGTIYSIDEERNRGQISVEELRHKITFLPLDFHRGLSKGDAITGGFHIAFNFISPLADPPKHYKSS